jgi:hypothetical protein
MDPKILKSIMKATVETVLREIFKTCWCLDTCSPDKLAAWSAANPAAGQADATVMVIRDLLGGEIVETQVNGFPHYYNRLKDGSDIDLTSSQYPVYAPIPAGAVMADPDDLFVGPEASRLKTYDRYALLSDLVTDARREFAEYCADNLDLPEDP